MTNNIILIGFMASGKSRIGKMLAERLRYDLIDIDSLIEEKTKKTIKEIFLEEGEYAFRKLEEEVINGLKDVKKTVIVPGGGAVINFNNAKRLKEIGKIYFLDANFPTILERIKNKNNRPLADERMEELFYFRRPIYKSLGDRIDVNHNNKDMTVLDIANRFKASLVLDTISCLNQKIFMNANILQDFNEILACLGINEKKIILITNDTIQEKLSNYIKYFKENYSCKIISIPDGEKYKNFSTVKYLYDELFRLKANRKTVVLAFGGGIITDLAGFVASTYMRGMPLINIPTTLLAMVDASVGGKTGYDNEYGKNLIGSFYNALAVVIDENLLSSLPKIEYSCGMAEIIKHAIIGDRRLFYGLLNQSLNQKEILKQGSLVKMKIIESDVYEENIRAYLNLGHTFAHAIEKASDYQVKHGQAVSMGLVCAINLAKKLNILEEDFSQDLDQILKMNDLPTQVFSYMKPSSIIDCMLYDKKQDDKGIKFILPIGLEKIRMEYIQERSILEEILYLNSAKI